MDTLMIAQAQDATALASSGADDKFAAHLIPTEILKPNGAEYLIRATVAFTPVPGASGQGGLNDWPKWIAKRFSNEEISISIRPPMKNVEGIKLPNPAKNAFTAGYARIHSDSAQALEQLTDIWRDWFDMPGLRLTLATAAQTTAANMQDMFQQSAEGEIEDGAAPDVISVPRAELARQTTLERARNLIESLACVQSPENKETIAKQREARDKARPDIVKRPWSKIPIGRERTKIIKDLLGDLTGRSPADLRAAYELEMSPPQQKALKDEPKADSDASLDDWRKQLRQAIEPKTDPAGKAQQPAPDTNVDFYEPFKYEAEKSDQWFQDLKAFLKDERNWLEFTLAIQLEDQRKAARNYVDACKDCADACGSAEIVLKTYLDKLEQQRVAYRAADMKATAQAVMESSSDQAAAQDAAAQNASTLQDYGSKAPDPNSNSELRWHALQGMPALMRAMHLVMDIEFTIDSAMLENKAEMLPGNGGLNDDARFVEFAIEAKDGETDYLYQKLWTLTKLQLPTDENNAGHCWPSTTEEWALRAATRDAQVDKKWTQAAPQDTGLLDQVDAVIDLEAPLRAGGQSFKRYDVFSLDVTITSEAEQRRQAVETQLKDAAVALPQDEKMNAIESSTLKTAGLQIVDRWRQGAVIDEIFTSCNSQSDSGRRLDANDLAIGYRLDVGLPTAKMSEGREWRSLSERIVHYTHAAANGLLDLEKAANAFSPQAADGVRPVDGATVAMGTRLVTNSRGGILRGGKETAFADQMLAAWDGDPIGMRTGSFEGRTNSVDLPVSRKLSLPDKGAARPHRLRIGGAYALGARSVLLGGVCMPLERAKKLYETGLGRGMAYPSSPNQIQRFLRQERIGPPIVAVEDKVLLTEFASERKGIDGKEMVVRSLPGDAGANEPWVWRFQPDETARILFAPLVDLDFAVMHSVYDTGAIIHKGKPPGGLQDIDYDSAWGGFPVFDPKEPPVEAAIRGHYRPYEGAHEKGAPKEGDKPAPGGFAVFRKRLARSGPREHEYYPDPAARQMVIALRRPEQPEGYLLDDAIVVPLYATPFKRGSATTPGYPDARPVMLKIKAANSTSVAVLESHKDLEKRAKEAGGALKAIHNGVTTVTLYLNPGENFEVETWCIPEEEHLRAWFDLPEAMALIMNCSGDNVAVQCCQAASNPNGSDATFTVRRGEASIPWSDIKTAASAVYNTLLSRPLPEIASIRRFRAIHAAGLPRLAPKGEDLELRRLMPATRKAWLEMQPGANVSQDEDGGSQIVALGSATFDPGTTETLELYAEAPMPVGGSFDNLELGRTFDKRARGAWPRTRYNENGQIEPIKASQRDPAGRAGPSYMDELFGFDVASDGKATLRRGQGLVARWQIDRDTTSPVDLAELTRKTKQMSEGGGDQAPADRKKSRSALESIFPDTLARRVRIWLAATSRTARQIPERLSYPTPDEAGRDRARLLAQDQPTEIVLRATERPAALTPKSLLPAYVWSTNGATRSRKAKVRIRLRRPWWTSGEDERLGIVVWPPNLMAATGVFPEQWQDSELQQGIIERKTPMTSKEGPLEIDLHQFANSDGASWREGFFTDADLGSGGSFVTRWGADPIFASEEMAWLIDAAAFRDISASRADFAEPIDLIKTADQSSGDLWLESEDYKPRFVENALMPIPEGDDNNQNDQQAASSGTAAPKVTPQFMMVSLVTYMPRFDPDFEHWYVDVDLDVGEARDPFVRFGLVRFQPHADRHLQVSQPVAEWVQVVGYLRDVTVARQSTNGRDWVSVTVSRTTGVDAAKRDKAESLGVATGEIPLIRVTLIECSRSPHGQVLERVARLDMAELSNTALAGQIDSDAGGMVIKTCQENTGASLLLDLRLPIPSSGAAQDLHYAVLVEELLISQRSSYSNEPVRKDADILDGERYIESGRRFAVRLELEPQQPPSDG